MADVLLTHSYHLYYDRKQMRKMQPYPPLGTLYALAAPLDPTTVDRPSTADVHEAADLLPTIGAQAARTVPSIAGV